LDNTLGAACIGVVPFLRGLKMLHALGMIAT
jgi:hypothetical protein